MQNNPERLGTVIKYSLDGTISRFFPAAEEDPQANFDALEAACAAIQSGDYIVLDENATYEKGDSGDGIDISGVADFKIANGYLTRDTSISFNYFFKLIGCSNFTIEDITMDGRAGVSAPTDTPPTHQNLYPNATSTCDLIRLENCNGGNISNCKFRDVITNETTFSGLPQYPNARGVFIASTCSNIRVESCSFKLIGYAGVRDDGVSSHIDGCIFDDCQWHGYVYNGSGDGFLKIHDCIFMRENFTTLAYAGGINVNPGGTFTKLSITNCSTYFPYDYLANTGGSYVIKLQDVEELIVRDCDLRHGINGAAGGGRRSSLRFQDYIGKATITDTWMDGAIWHISWEETPYELKIENSTVNGSNYERWAMYVGAKSLSFINSQFGYHDYAVAILPPFVATPGNVSVESSYCRYMPDNSMDSYIMEEAFIGQNPHRVKFDATNVIQVSGRPDTQEGEDVSPYSHSKSDTIVGNLIMSTRGSDPMTKLWDNTLTGAQAHAAPSGTLPNGPFFPSLSGFPGMVVENLNWEYSASPTGVEHVDYWKWDTNLNRFTTRGI